MENTVAVVLFLTWPVQAVEETAEYRQLLPPVEQCERAFATAHRRLDELARLGQAVPLPTWQAAVQADLAWQIALGLRRGGANDEGNLWDSESENMVADFRYRAMLLQRAVGRENYYKGLLPSPCP